jgi:transposase
VIAELLGKAFGGRGDQTLVSDFYSVYDQFEGPQQKCLTHLLRELRDTIARRPELSGHAFFVRCKRLVQDMLKLKKRRAKLKAAHYRRRVERLERRLDELARQPWNDADADRLSGRLNKYRSKLTTFLHKKEVDGTNNAAERALRPAVVMRKITGGSRSAAGAKAWVIVASVMRTAEQQGKDVLESIKTLLKAEWSGKETALLTELLPLDST